MNTTAEITAAALQLDEPQRFDVTAQLWLSLGGDAETLADLVAARRAREIDEGRVTLLTQAEVFAAARSVR